MDRGASQANTTTYPCCGPDTYTYGQEIEQEWLATIRARLGWDLGGIFVYGTAGAAFSDVTYSHTFSDTFSPVAALTYSNSDTLTGWTGGVGVETGLGGALSVKAEYLYADLGDIDTGGAIFGGGPTIDSTAEIESSIFRFGVNWHF
jgi:outer membrane immunogenic protein